MLNIVSPHQNFSKWPRSCRSLLSILRPCPEIFFLPTFLGLVLNNTGGAVAQFLNFLIDDVPVRVKEKLGGSVWTDDVQTDGRGEEGACVKEKM